MSKQSEAKEKQVYVAKVMPMTCGNCAHLKCDMELPKWMAHENAASHALGRPAKYGDNNKAQKNLRCGIGGFAVKKMGTCDEWGGKSE